MNYTSVPPPPSLCQSSSSEPQNTKNNFSDSSQFSQVWYIHGTIRDAEQVRSYTAHNRYIGALELDSFIESQMRKIAGLRFRLIVAPVLSLIGTIAHTGPKSCFELGFWLEVRCFDKKLHHDPLFASFTRSAKRR